MESKGEDKAVSPQRSRRNSEPPKKAKVEKSATTTPVLQQAASAGADADAAPPKKSREATKKRRSAVFDTRELASSLKVNGDSKDASATAEVDAGAPKASKIRRSVSGSSLKAKSIKTTRTAEPAGNMPVHSGADSRTKAHTRAESGVSDSASLTNEEINIMGITVTTKVPRSKSKSFRSGEKARQQLHSQSTDSVPGTTEDAGAAPTTKKSSKKKGSTEVDTDLSKDRAEAELDTKIATEDGTLFSRFASVSFRRWTLGLWAVRCIFFVRVPA